jgi:hypothetical protein
MFTARKMTITVMPLVLITLVGVATTHRDIARGDRLSVTSGRLSVAGDRDVVSKDPHLVADRDFLRAAVSRNA